MNAGCTVFRYDESESTMKRATVRKYLVGGDRRSIGRADELASLLAHRPALLPELVQEMWSDDPVVAMRAADVLEKVTRTQPQELQRFKKELIGLAEETRQQELRWHLAAMIPRLELSPSERQRATTILTQYLEDKSSIVKTFALQALFDLSVIHPSLRPQVEELLRAAVRSGTPAMKARSRKLLGQMGK